MGSCASGKVCRGRVLPRLVHPLLILLPISILGQNARLNLKKMSCHNLLLDRTHKRTHCRPDPGAHLSVKRPMPRSLSDRLLITITLRFSPTPPSLSTQMKPSVGISSLSPSSNHAFHPASFINLDSAVNSFLRLLRRFLFLHFTSLLFIQSGFRLVLCRERMQRDHYFSVTWNVENFIEIYLYFIY